MVTGKSRYSCPVRVAILPYCPWLKSRARNADQNKSEARNLKIQLTSVYRLRDLRDMIWCRDVARNVSTNLQKSLYKSIMKNISTTLQKNE